MKTSRENILNKLILDDFIPDQSDANRGREPRAELSLFAQTSSFERSESYLKHLKEITRLELDEEQEKLLAHLLVNWQVLKNEVRGNLWQWTDYLKQYQSDRKVNIKNRLYAQALLLCIDKNRPEREVAEFEFTWKAFCHNVFRTKNIYLYHAVKRLVAQARGEDSLAAPLNIDEFLSQLHGNISLVNTLGDAQLILAPWVAEDPTTILAKVASLAPTSMNGTWYTGQVYLLLHALLILLPSDKRFGLQNEGVLENIRSKLDIRLRYYGSDILEAHTELMVALLKGLPSTETVAKAVPWNNTNRFESQSQQENDYIISKEYCELLTDADRVEFLKNFRNNIWRQNQSGKALFSIPRKICLQLTSDSAKAEAVDILLSAIETSKHLASTTFYHIYNENLINLIRVLILRTKDDVYRTTMVNSLFHLYKTHGSYNYVSALNIQNVSFLFNLYPDIYNTTHLQDNQALQEYYYYIKSPTEVSYWLKKLQTQVEGFSDDDYDNREVDCIIAVRMYAHFIAKKGDSALAESLLTTLYRQFNNTTNTDLVHVFFAEFAMDILPFAVDEKIINQWMAILLSELKERDLNSIHCHDFSDCMTALLPKLSPELRLHYCQQIKDIVFPKLAADDLTFYEHHSPRLKYILSLLQQLPDKMVLELNAQPTNNKLALS